MWEGLVLSPRGRLSARKFALLLATIVVSAFAYLFIASPTTFAADAQWSNDSITYNGKTFDGPTTVQNGDGTGLANGVKYYTAQPAGNNASANTTTVIYFPADKDPPKEKSGRLADATLKNGNVANVNTGQSSTIAITPAANQTSSNSNQSSSSTDADSACKVDGGLGWVICPVTNTLAKGMDVIYKFISMFLYVQPTQTNTDNAMYRAWSYMRNIANIAFVIGFMGIIYSQLTSIGLSNYNVKKMLPRVVVAAIFVNISYWICAAAIDVTNILGYSIQDLFITIRNSLVGSEGNNWNIISWQSVATLILSGGVVAAGAGAGVYQLFTNGSFATAGSGSIAAGAQGLLYIFLPILITVIFVVLITFLILAARQALITIFVIIAPIAFVAYLLPNTEKWFNQWRDTFLKLLIVFPGFSFIFGGSQLAAAIIIQNAKGGTAPIMVLLAMGVQVMPLAITPLLLRLGGGLLNRFAGIVNNPTKGIFDRGKNWANERRDQTAARGKAALANRAKEMGYPGAKPRSSKRNRFARTIENGALSLNPYNMAYAREHNRQQREGMKTANESLAQGLFSQTAAGRAIDHQNRLAGFEKHAGENASGLAWEHRVHGNPATGTTGNHYLHQLHEQAHRDEGLTKAIQEADSAHANRDLQTYIANTPGYRNMKVRATVDSGQADLQAGLISAEGDLAFRQEVDASRALTRMVKDTHHTKKQADSFEKIVQSAAEKSWNDRVRNDDATQELYLRTTRNEEGTKLSEQQVASFVENIKAKGSDAPNVTINAQGLADNIRASQDNIDIETQIQQSAQKVQRADFANLLKSDAALRQRAAGVDPNGAVRVFASAQSQVTSAMFEDIKNIQNTMPYDRAANSQRLERELKANPSMPMEEQIALIFAASKNGNSGYEAAIRMIDWYQTSGGVNGGAPKTSDFINFKEILGTNEDLKKGGRDLELYLNNGNDTTRTIQDYTNDVGTWNIDTSRFVAMKEERQMKAIEALSNAGPDGLQKLQVIRRDIMATPPLRAGIKDRPKQALNIPLTEN